MVGWCMVVTIMSPFSLQSDIFWSWLVTMVGWCMLVTIMSQFRLKSAISVNIQKMMMYQQPLWRMFIGTP